MQIFFCLIQYVRQIWSSKMEWAIVKLAGGITGLVAAIFALRKFYMWLFPVRVEPSASLNFDGTKRDSIGAEVINRSTEPQYIVECSARGTYSLWHIARRHLKRPFLRPRLYPNIWYHGAVYQLLDGEPVKLEPGQPLNLECELYEHPLNAMYTPYFVVKVKLSSGRTVRSSKLQAPGRWRYIGRNELNNEIA